MEALIVAAFFLTGSFTIKHFKEIGARASLVKEFAHLHTERQDSE